MIMNKSTFSIVFILYSLVLIIRNAEPMINFKFKANSKDYGFQLFTSPLKKLNTSDFDFFNILTEDSENIVIGARDYVYNISRKDLSISMKIHWPVTLSKTNISNKFLNFMEKIHFCKQIVARNYRNIIKDYSYLCDNTIRLAIPNKDHITFCGHHRLFPKCRNYVIKNGEYKFINSPESIGKNLFPIDAQTDIVYLLDGNSLWSGAMFQKDEYSVKTMIVKRIFKTNKLPASKDKIITSWQSYQLKYDHMPHLLDEAKFVDIRKVNKSIMYFFNQAKLYDDIPNIPCSFTNPIRSYLLTACLNDNGDSSEMLTSMLHLSISCSLKYSSDNIRYKSNLFEFHKIVSVSKMRRGNFEVSKDKFSKNIFYAIFQLSIEDLSSSAICVFYEDSISSAMKNQFVYGMNSQGKLERSNYKTTNDPMACADTFLDPRIKSNDIHYNYIDNIVTPIFDNPFLIIMNHGYIMTCIVVDWQVKTILNNEFVYRDVIYVGTTLGTVLQILKSHSKETLITQRFNLLSTPIDSIRLDSKSLIVIGKSNVARISYRYCNPSYSCRECVALQSPYCSYYNGQCKNSINGVQNLTSGISSKCIEKDFSETFDEGITIFKITLSKITNILKLSESNKSDTYKNIYTDIHTDTSSTSFKQTSSTTPLQQKDSIPINLMSISKLSSCNCSTTIIVICTALLSILLGFIIGYLCTKERWNYVTSIIFRLIGRKPETSVVKTVAPSLRSKESSLTRNPPTDNHHPLTTYLQINSIHS